MPNHGACMVAAMEVSPRQGQRLWHLDVAEAHGAPNGPASGNGGKNHKADEAPSNSGGIRSLHPEPPRVMQTTEPQRKPGAGGEIQLTTRSAREIEEGPGMSMVTGSAAQRFRLRVEGRVPQVHPSPSG